MNTRIWIAPPNTPLPTESTEPGPPWVEVTSILNSPVPTGLIMRSTAVWIRAE